MGRLRLLIGTAGSGKTRQMLREVAQAAAEDRQLSPADLLSAPPLLVIVPEQQALSIERAVLAELADRHGIMATSRVLVASLSRLGRILLDYAGQSPTPPDELTRLLLAWRLLRREGQEAEASQLVGLLSELDLYTTPAHKTEPLDQRRGNLRQRAAELEAEAATHSRPAARRSLQKLASKLKWLAGLLADYREECLKLGLDFRPPAARITPELLINATQLTKRNWRQARIWLDGFAGFTPTELNALRMLLTNCAEMSATLLLDPARLAGPAQTDSEDWYAPTRELYQTWLELAESAGVGFSPADDVVLPSSPVGEEIKVAALSQGSAPPLLTGLTGETPTGLRAAVCDSERTEVEYACRTIKRLVGIDGYQYRQISIITRKLEPYAELLTAKLTEYGIPCFLDQLTKLGPHPLVEMLRSAVRLLLGQARPDDVYSLLSTGLMPAAVRQANPLSMDSTDLLISFGRRFNIKPTEWLCVDLLEHKPWLAEILPAAQRSYNLPQLEEWRRELLSPLRELAQLHREGGRLSVREWLHELRTRLLGGDLIERLGQWSEDCQRSGLTNAAAAHAGVVAEVESLLDRFSLLAGDVLVGGRARDGDGLSMPVQEFVRWVEHGLDQLTLGHAPATQDVVLITEIERGRLPDVKATFIMGLADDTWPYPASETPYFTDSERATINRSAKAGNARAAAKLLADGSSENAEREPYFAMVALTRATECWLSYPQADAQGGERRPSRYFSGACAAAGLDPAQLPTITGADLRADYAETVCLGDLALSLALKPSASVTAAGLLTGSDSIGQLRGLTWGRRYAGVPAARPMRGNDLTEALPAGTCLPLLKSSAESTAVEMSASRLESFAACPFSHFARYYLALDEDPASSFGAREAGNLYHQVLQETIDDVPAGNWQQLSEDELVTIAIDKLREHCKELKAWVGRERVSHLESRAELILRHLINQLLGNTSLKGNEQHSITELKFAQVAGGPDAVELDIDGELLRLSGKIDRLDFNEEGQAAVVDYKLSLNQGFQWWRLVAGTALQLPLYLMAVEGWQPPVADVPPLRPQYAELQRIEPKLSADQDADFSAERLIAEPQGGDSKPANGLGVDVAISTARQVIEELAVRMLADDIRVWPVRSPDGRQTACGYCAYRSVCRFDPRAGDSYRQAEPVSRQDLTERDRGEGPNE